MVPVVKQHINSFGTVPSAAATDRGFAILVNEKII